METTKTTKSWNLIRKRILKPSTPSEIIAYDIRRNSRMNVFKYVNDRMSTYFTEDDSTLEIKTLTYDLNAIVSLNQI